MAASDYVKALPDALGRWLDQRLVTLGTDGFRAQRTPARRCATSSRWTRGFITVATLEALARDGAVEPAVVARAIAELGIDPDKPDPAVS